MPGEGTQVLNRIHNIEPCEPKGLNVIWETTNSNPNPLASFWQSVTGSSQGSSVLPDVLFGQTANVSIKGAGQCPTNCRPYITRLLWSVNGTTAWTTLTSLTIQDTLGNPVYFIPTVALKGLASGASNTAEGNAPNTATVSSYAAGVLTFPASTFTTTRFQNTMATIVGGTGIGQSFLIASNTTNTLTAVTAPPIPPDSTSIVAVWYNAATAGAGTTITDAKAAFPDLSNGYSVVIVSGTGAGQVRLITSNTTTAITVNDAWTTNPDNTSNFYVTTNPSGMGAVDQTSALLAAFAPNTGVSVAINGTAGSGSPVRFLVEGFWAY